MHPKKFGLVLFSLIIVITMISIPVEGASACRWRYRRRDTVPPEVTITNPVKGEIVSEIVTVSFTAVDNFRWIRGYQVYIDGELRLSLRGFRALFRRNQAPTYQWDTTLDTEGAHNITCKACDLRGNWGFATISVIIDTPPAQITGLNVTTIDSAGISLEWNENTGADFSHYLVYRDGEVVTKQFYPYFDDIGLLPETTYSYEVSAIDTSGNEGLKSLPASATTNPGEPNGGPIAADSIVLNEFLPVPNTLYSEEWIELYNPLSQDVDVSGYILDDVIGVGTAPYIILSGTIIPANGFLVFYQSETNIGLNTAGDTVNYIYSDGITVIDSYTYGSSSDDVSYGRETDGGTPWITFDQPSPGESNAVSTLFLDIVPVNVFSIDPDTIYFEEWIESPNPFSDKLVRHHSW